MTRAFDLNVSPRWRISDGKWLVLDRPRVLGILNLTPDSFSDGGEIASAAHAAEIACGMVAEGTDGLDLGAESTRPGAHRIDAGEQKRRLIPAVEAVRKAVGDGVPLTVDTTLAEVAAAAFDAGADAINDVSAGTEDPPVLALAAARGRGLILMHRLTTPDRDRYSDAYGASPPVYADLVAEVAGFLGARAEAAIDAGVPRDAIVVDPGLGFGKTVEQNLALITGTARLCELGFPVLSGLSRKSFVARAAGTPDSRPRDRLAETLALSVRHLICGASLFRVHDVGAHRRALDAEWASFRARRAGL